MDHEERATFQTCTEVLEHSIDYVKSVRDALDALREIDHGERIGEMLEEIELEERRLLGALERYLEDVDGGAFQTYEQFMVPLPKTLPEAEIASIDDAARWAYACNEPLITRFQELAETAATDELAEAFQSLVDLVRNADKRITTAYDGLKDI